jgi:hypothetical protein
MKNIISNVMATISNEKVWRNQPAINNENG